MWKKSSRILVKNIKLILYRHLPESRSPSCGETPNSGYGAQRQWDPRYGSGLRGQSHDGHRHLEKKESALQQVNERLLPTMNPEEVEVMIHKVEAAEVDEMWGFMGSKSQQRWLWHAMDHHTGQILAYVFGTREDEAFLELKALLKPFGITRFYTDG
jgi:hypothetical protein